MLHPEALLLCHSTFFKRIERACDSAVAYGVGIDLKSLSACRVDDLSELCVVQRSQAVFFRRISVRLCHLGAARAEGAIENQLEASNCEHSAAKVRLRSTREIVRHCRIAKYHRVDPDGQLAAFEQILVNAKNLKISPSVMDAGNSPPGELLKRDADMSLAVCMLGLLCYGLNQCSCVVNYDAYGLTRGIAPNQ